MKKGILWLMFVMLSLYSWAQPGKTIDKIIGGVGAEVVLLSDLENAKFELTQGKSQLPAEKECSIFEDLLYQKLLLHQAKVDSVEVTDGEVNAQVEKRITYFVEMLGSVEQFETYYGKPISQLKIDFFDMIRDQLLTQKKQEEITKNVKITPSQVLKYYQSLPIDSLPLIGEQVQYSQIVIAPLIPESENQKTIQFLDSIRNDIASGRSSMTIQARRHSEDPGSKFKGGCYDMIRKGSFVPEYESAVFTTDEGNYSPVFKSTYGYHFVKVVEKRGEYYRACHILMSPKIKDEDFNLCKTRLDSVYNELKAKKISFNAAAARYSTDEETKNQAGKIMNMQTGGTRHDVASLTSEMNLVLMSMKEGELSTPILVTGDDNSQSYAFYRLDRRIPAHPANMKDDYDIFKQVAEANARRESTDKWVKKKIADTSIQIDEEYRNLAFDFTWVK